MDWKLQALNAILVIVFEFKIKKLQEMNDFGSLVKVIDCQSFQMKFSSILVY